MGRTAIFMMLFALISCGKKNDDSKELTAATVSSDGLMPLKYHAVSFQTNYPTIPGKVPPFSFTKTLYPDTRVATLKMLSRAVPNYPTYKQQAYDWDCKFSYSLNASHMTGTRRLLEYSIDPVNKTGITTVIKTEPLSYDFHFNVNNHCDHVWSNGLEIAVPQYGFDDNPAVDTTLINFYLPNPPDGNIVLYYFDPASPTKPMFSTFTPYNRWVPLIAINYQLAYSGKNEFYQPSQYAFSQEYSLLEVMQWLPWIKRERKSVKLEFWTSNDDNSRVVQGQHYYNHKYDANGNLISYTYGDGVPQKITWK